MSKVWWRTLLLISLSGGLLGLMAGYVKLTQHQPNPDVPLDVSVTRDIIWPWQETELRVHYSGEEGTAVISAPPSATDVVFLLDTSGSMDDSNLLGSMQEIQRFPRDHGPNTRVAVVEFAVQARVVRPFTQDSAVLQSLSLSDFRHNVGGGTAFIAGLEEALKLLGSQPRSTVVLLTDGQSSEERSDLRHFYEQVWQPTGHELFMVGIGTDGADPTSFLQLTDDPAHYIVRSVDRTALSGLFEAVRERMGNVLGRDAKLTLPLAEPLWERASAEDGTSNSDVQSLPEPETASVVHPLGTLFQRPYEWTAPITPRFSGILTTLADPVQLNYLGQSSQGLERRELRTEGQAPKVLAITPWLLFWLLLPALLYLLAAVLEWLNRRSAEIPVLPPVPRMKTYRPPPDLPYRFSPAGQRIRWAPSLVLGLGGAGRHVLTHIRQVLNDSLDEPTTRPVLLALDVARDDVDRPAQDQITGCLEPLDDKDQVFILPQESCDLTESVHLKRTPEDPASALDLRSFRQLGEDALRLKKGTQGQAPLARLALLNDLAAGSASALLKRLQETLTDWRSLAPEQRYRQILLVANAHGGVGSGWLSDLVILLRRLVKTDEAEGRAVEICVLLVGEETPQRERAVPMKASTLFAELDRLASAGRQKFRHRLSKDTTSAPELLDGWVERRPQDAIFVLTGKREDWVSHSYPAAADAACLLLEQKRRAELTQMVQGLQVVEEQQRAVNGCELYTQLAVYNAVFPRSFGRELMANRLGYLLAGKQILFPGLVLETGQPKLQEPAIDAASLLVQKVDATGEQRIPPGGAEQLTLDALRDAALGDSAQLVGLKPSADTLRHTVHGMRLLLVDNANRLLIEERSMGLAGLLQATRSYAGHLHGLEPEGVRELAAACDALADQAARWIELFLGTAALPRLEQQEREADESEYGFVLDCERRCETHIQILQEWERGRSRLLMGAITAQELKDKEACKEHLNRQLQESFLPLWLGAATGSVETLAARCHWEVTMLGLDGEPLGLCLVFRGSKIRRYVPQEEELLRFQADLSKEVESVLDAENDFHILTLVHDRLDPPDQSKFVSFITDLKGDLKGERSSLLLALPQAMLADSQSLEPLRVGLKQAFEKETAGAAELVYTHDSEDRYRISLLQLLPLLTVAPQNAIEQPLHPYERRRRDYSQLLAQELGRLSVPLPAAAGIALQNEARLREFALLYAAGHIQRRTLDDLWHLRDGSQWHSLSFLPEQTLADAAAYFVTQDDLTFIADVTPQEPLPDAAAEDHDFTTLLEWLLQQESLDTAAHEQRV